MKFSTTLFAVVLAAASVSAVAIPEADPCDHPGQPCKRDAEAAACDHPGQPCAKVKRAADAFAEALAEAGPEDVFLDARCDLAECFQARRATRSLASLVAMTRDAPEEYMRSLNLEDEEKLKRDAEADPCDHPGQPCKREAKAAACDHPGQPCSKLRRAAKALAEASANPSAVKRNAEAEPCDHPGQPCKREAEPVACDHPGQPCAKAIRDLYALENAARDVLYRI